jgi:hypothetical protein
VCVLLLICFSMVYWMLGCMELNSFNVSSKFVCSSLYVICRQRIGSNLRYMLYVVNVSVVIY